MSTINELIEIADYNAFSNLYDVLIGRDEVVQKYFKLRIENITIDGFSIEYLLNDANRQFQIKKANKIRNVTISVRESGGFYFYQYLNSWFVSVYDPYTNTYTVGNNDLIARKRPITISAYGNQNSSVNPPLYISTNSAMIEKCPSINMSWSDSKPIVYQVSFVCDNLDIKFPDSDLKTIAKGERSL